MIPVFGIAGVVHKCAGEVQLFPQFQVQPEADCMENGLRTVALCIECLRFHFVPVDVLGIPFPSEHVVDFVDGGYSKAVLVGKVKVELATVAAGQVVDAFVHLIIVAEGTSQQNGVEVGVTVYSPVSFEVSFVDEATAHGSGCTEFIRYFCRYCRYRVRIVVVEVLVQPKAEVVLFIVHQLFGYQSANNVYLSQNRLIFLPIQIRLDGEIVVRFGIFRIEAVAVFDVDFGGQTHTFVQNLVFQFQGTYTQRYIHTYIGYTELLTRSGTPLPGISVDNTGQAAHRGHQESGKLQSEA